MRKRINTKSKREKKKKAPQTHKGGGMPRVTILKEMEIPTILRKISFPYQMGMTKTNANELALARV